MSADLFHQLRESFLSLSLLFITQGVPEPEVDVIKQVKYIQPLLRDKRRQRSRRGGLGAGMG
jgi:hypothetical protein